MQERRKRASLYLPHGGLPDGIDPELATTLLGASIAEEPFFFHIKTDIPGVYKVGVLRRDIKGKLKMRLTELEAGKDVQDHVLGHTKANYTF